MSSIVHDPSHLVTRAKVPVGWRLALAGGIAGSLTNLVLFPLDTVKTLRQADPARFPGALPAAIAIVRTRGLQGLYAGITPALVGSALSSALYFGTYEFVRSRMREIAEAARKPRSKSFFSSPLRRIPGNALAAASGNIASSVLFVPKEVVKQRMQAGLTSGEFVTAALGLFRADGIAGLYRGYKATLLRNIPSTMLRFALYEEAKVMLSAARVKYRGRTISEDRKLSSVERPARRTNQNQVSHSFSKLQTPIQHLTTWEHVAAGAASGAVASAITTPMDVVKTRLATSPSRPGIGVFRVAANIVREHGVSGLYVGLKPRILWAALFAAIGFSSYEFCKSYLVRQEEIPTLAFARPHASAIYRKR